MSYVADFLGEQGFGAYLVDWSQGHPTFERVNRHPDLLLVPGFVDLHIHGAFGIDCMAASTADMLSLCDKLRQQNYEAFLPTTVAASFEDVRRAVASLPDHPMIPGFHLEGPFLSPKYPGAQPAASIQDPPAGPSEWDAIFEHPLLRIVTMAPERPHALERISFLAQRGVIVSMGHTDATFAEARYGFEFGARHTTHTFNAMRPFHHREAGMVGYALGNDSLACELIYDRHHVAKDAAALLLQAKPADKVLAVSDGTMASGIGGARTFSMWGVDVETYQGRICLAGTDTLAGSAITLLDAFRNLAEDFGPETAIRLCSLNPRLALGITEKPSVYGEFDKQLRLVGLRMAA